VRRKSRRKRRNAVRSRGKTPKKKSAIKRRKKRNLNAVKERKKGSAIERRG
jgi:hypothetical protein